MTALALAASYLAGSVPFGLLVTRAAAHKDVRTTMIYTHVLNRGGRGVRSPADCFGE